MDELRYHVVRARESGQYLCDYPTERYPDLPWAFSPRIEDAASFLETEADILARDFLPVACDVIEVVERTGAPYVVVRHGAK